MSERNRRTADRKPAMLFDVDESVGKVLAENVALIMYGDGGAVVVPRVAPPAGDQAGAPSSNAELAGDRLLSRRDVASWLSVSTRWVERHLRPSVQATPRGRAWYTRDDVEAQLARLHDRKKPRSRRTAGDSSLTSAQRRARREAASGGSTFQGIEHARKVAEVEQSLRASVESAQHRKRGRKRGER